MKKISVNVSDELYFRLREKATDEAKKQKKFVGITDLIIPTLQKEFGK